MSENTHEDLSNLIKDTHKELRKQCLKGQNPRNVWNEHLKDTEKLGQYAAAMSTLAKEYWAKKKETRIEWCHEFLTKYYSADGLLKKLMDKDRRTFDFHNLKERDKQKLAEADGYRCCGEYFESDAQDQLELHCQRVTDTLSSRFTSNSITLPLTNHIHLLDVGSCYAPFQKYAEYDCLSVDICPANEEVAKCDFINVDVRSDRCDDDDLAKRFVTTDDSGQKVVTYLSSQYFHGVIFSLLLEYLPAPALRWACCVNAHKLLVMNGVLVIVTPDSNKQHRNAPQMNDWKLAIESIGFHRCAYVKLEHVHCMAFRKTSMVLDYDNLKDNSSQLHIPQDFNTQVSCSRSSDLEPDDEASKPKKMKMSDL